MPRKRDISLTLALCLSLTAHAWIVYTVAERYVSQYALLKLDPPAALSKLIAVENKPPPPENPVLIDRMSQLGEQDTAGQALASLDDEKPQQAPKADQEQAPLSLDTEGENGKKDEAASPAPPPSPPAFAAVNSSAAAPAFSLPGSASDQIPVLDERFEGPKLRDQQDKDPEQKEDSPNPEAPGPQLAAQQQRPSPPVPQQPSAPPQSKQADSRAPGDPAPLAESESDPFSTTGAVDFSRGKTTARFGRKHKLFRPRLEMAGHADMMQTRGPIVVVLRIYTDVAGNVEKVDIVKSSGSINIDQPTRLAAYRWWFEPPLDSNGNPKTDVFEFMCRFI